MKIPAVARMAVGLGVTAMLLPGCAREITRAIVPNQPPEVTLEVEAVSEGSGTRYQMSWSGHDPDGSIDHYLVAAQSPSLADGSAGWTLTRQLRHSAEIARPAVSPMGVVAPGPGPCRILAVRAVDDDGAVSLPAAKAFFGDNAAPLVWIGTPRGVPLHPALPVSVPSSLRIEWSGTDVDGSIVEYRYRVFGRSNPDAPHVPDFVTWMLAHPDSFAMLYAPDFKGWTSTPAATPSAQVTLAVGETYGIAITAIDDRGGYDALFTPERNLVHVVVANPSAVAPIVQFAHSWVYANVGYVFDPSHWFNIEVPADQLIAFSIVPPVAPLARVLLWRWKLDKVPGPEDEWSKTPGRVEMGPFSVNGEVHFLYVEIQTTASTFTAIFRFTVVRPTFQNPLLFVDDTRLAPDIYTNGQLDPPRGQWPGGAELDTFLFARGGFPWRGYPTNAPADPGWPRLPSGQPLTIPGVFAGYLYDTIGTRGIVGNSMPLSILGRYRHVVWYTDATGATYTGNPQSPVAPSTLLRRMNAPGGNNTLAQWVADGGRLWLMGGGAAYATLIDWNRPGTPTDEYTDDDLELVPGRFMYDWSHWRTRIRTPVSANRLARHVHSAETPFEDPSTAPGRGWPGPGYAGLPLELNPRSTATDPLPPRVVASNFYTNVFQGEIVAAPNAIIEKGASALDTLYFARFPGLDPISPAMTLYHGTDVTPGVFMGAPLWHFRRSQVIALGDWVLQSLWGLPRDPSVSRDAAPKTVAAGPIQRRE